MLANSPDRALAALEHYVRKAELELRLKRAERALARLDRSK